MTPFEQELAALAVEVFPETPDLATSVASRIPSQPVGERWWRRRRRTLALAVAVSLVAIGAAFAVPQARSTILRWFGFGGIEVRLVDRLPPVPTESVLQVGVRVTLDEAQRRAGFRVLVPSGPALGDPDAVYVGHFVVTEATLLYGRPGSVRLLLTEAVGRLNIAFAGKILGPGTRLKRLTLGGRPALWIEGSPHVFYFVATGGQIAQGSLRLAKDTLLWQRGKLVLRLEGDLTLAQALAVARSLR